MRSCKIHYDNGKISLVEVDGVDMTRGICTRAEDIAFYFRAGEVPILDVNITEKRRLIRRISRILRRWRHE